jgi:hypothetical protein
VQSKERQIIFLLFSLRGAGCSLFFRPPPHPYIPSFWRCGPFAARSRQRGKMKRAREIKKNGKKAPTSGLWRLSGVELQCDDEEEDELSSRLAAAAAATSRSSRSSSGAPSAMLVQRGTDALSSGRAADDGADGDVDAVKPLPHPVSPKTRIKCHF